MCSCPGLMKRLQIKSSSLSLSLSLGLSRRSIGYLFFPVALDQELLEWNQNFYDLGEWRAELARLVYNRRSLSTSFFCVPSCQISSLSLLFMF